jgi:hypothetical protein
MEQDTKNNLMLSIWLLIVYRNGISLINDHAALTINVCKKRLDNPLAFEGLSRRYPFYRLLITAELQFHHHSENPVVFFSIPEP